MQFWISITIFYLKFKTYWNYLFHAAYLYVWAVQQLNSCFQIKTVSFLHLIEINNTNFNVSLPHCSNKLKKENKKKIVCYFLCFNFFSFYGTVVIIKWKNLLFPFDFESVSFSIQLLQNFIWMILISDGYSINPFNFLIINISFSFF